MSVGDEAHAAETLFDEGPEIVLKDVYECVQPFSCLHLALNSLPNCLEESLESPHCWLLNLIDHAFLQSRKEVENDGEKAAGESLTFSGTIVLGRRADADIRLKSTTISSAHAFLDWSLVLTCEPQSSATSTSTSASTYVSASDSTSASGQSAALYGVDSKCNLEVSLSLRDNSSNGTWLNGARLTKNESLSLDVGSLDFRTPSPLFRRRPLFPECDRDYELQPPRQVVSLARSYTKPVHPTDRLSTSPSVPPSEPPSKNSLGADAAGEPPVFAFQIGLMVGHPWHLPLTRLSPILLANLPFRVSDPTHIKFLALSDRRPQAPPALALSPATRLQRPRESLGVLGSDARNKGRHSLSQKHLQRDQRSPSQPQPQSQGQRQRQGQGHGQGHEQGPVRSPSNDFAQEMLEAPHWSQISDLNLLGLGDAGSQSGIRGAGAARSQDFVPELKRLESAVGSLTLERRTLTEKLSESQEEVNELKMKQSELESALEEKLRERRRRDEASSQRQQDALLDLEMERKKILSLNAQISTLVASKETLLCEKSSLQERLDLTELKQKQLQQKLRDLTQKGASLEDENAGLLSTQKRVEAELRKSKRMNSDLQASVDFLTKAETANRLKDAQIKEEILNLRRRIQELETEVNLQTQENRSQRQKHLEMSQQLSHICGQFDEAGTKLKAVADDCAAEATKPFTLTHAQAQTQAHLQTQYDVNGIRFPMAQNLTPSAAYGAATAGMQRPMLALASASYWKGDARLGTRTDTRTDTHTDVHAAPGLSEEDETSHDDIYPADTNYSDDDEGNVTDVELEDLAESAAAAASTASATGAHTVADSNATDATTAFEGAGSDCAKSELSAQPESASKRRKLADAASEETAAPSSPVQAA